MQFRTTALAACILVPLLLFSQSQSSPKPVMPVNGFMVSGMLTRGKNCEDSVVRSEALGSRRGRRCLPARAKDRTAE